MSVSFGSFLSGFFATILLSLYGYFSLTHVRRSVYWDLRVLIILFLAASARMLLPINLPINISLYSHSLLVPFSRILFFEVPGTGLFFVTFLILFSISISIILLIRRLRNRNSFRQHIQELTYSDKQLTTTLLNHPYNNTPDKITALYINTPVSPFVFGILNPVIVLPYGIYTEREQSYILQHELTHIRQHDLFVKEIFDLLTALFWWNPFLHMLQKHLTDAIELSNDVALFQTMNENEKLDYASLLLKTAPLAEAKGKQQILTLSTHADPILRRRVEDIISIKPPARSLLLLHVCILLLITSLSFLITPEPSSISEEAAHGSYDLEQDLGATEENTYIIDKGDHYELYVNGEFLGEFQNISEDFQNYPIYSERPDPQ